MPVKRHGIGRCHPLLATHAKDQFTRTQGQIAERCHTAKQVYAVRPGKKIKKRAVRIPRKISTFPNQLPPSNQLRTDKRATEKQCRQQPALVLAVVLSMKLSARCFHCDTANQN